MYFVYVLFSEKDQKLYAGYTNNLKRRFSEHKRGSVKSTKYRRPLQLIHYECYRVKEDALAREKYLKGGGRARANLRHQLSGVLKLMNELCLLG